MYLTWQKGRISLSLFSRTLMSHGNHLLKTTLLNTVALKIDFMCFVRQCSGHGNWVTE